MLLPGSAVQVTEVTSSLTVKSPSVTGVGNVILVGVTVQPGNGLTATSANGWSAGMVTVTPTVLAVSDSVGTRKVNVVESPAAAVEGSTVTCAAATPAPATRVRAAKVTVVITRRHRRPRGENGMKVLGDEEVRDRRGQGR